MDYTARYGLEFNPFLKNSKEVLVETQEYKEVLFRLNYLLTTKGFGLLTGSAGRGKTTAVRNWASGLNTSLYKVVYSSLSTLTVNDFYRNLAAELGAQPAFRKTDNFKIIQDEINRLVLEKRQTPVIIIDEANYIGNAVLNDLKMLFNFEMDSKDRAVVLLSGLPQLNSTLRLSIHEPFRQRIVMNYNLEGMTKAEGHSYVAAKLNGAGCTQTVFEDNALEAILNAANGTPRMINKLCNASLLVGNSSNLNIITADAVMQAIQKTAVSVIQMLRDLAEQVFKIIIRFQVVGFRCFCNTIYNGARFCPCNRIDHHPVLLADAESADRLLGGVVVHWDFSVIKEYLQVFFLVDGVIQPLPFSNLGSPFLNTETCCHHRCF